MGYDSVFENQKTTLKKECDEQECLASEFDNIWYNISKIKITKSDVIHFYKDFETLKLAGEVSDHIPIWVEINLN